MPREEFAWNDIMSVCSVKGNISYKQLCMYYFNLILILHDSSSGQLVLNWSLGVTFYVCLTRIITGNLFVWNMEG